MAEFEAKRTAWFQEMKDDRAEFKKLAAAAANDLIKNSSVTQEIVGEITEKL